MVRSKNAKAAGQPAVKYAVAQSQTIGKYLIAAKDLAPGEAILHEDPATVGPSAFFSDSLCFGCLRPQKTCDAGYICSNCNVAPLCDSTCERKAGHHSSKECQLFKSNQAVSTSDLLENLAILLPLRMWLLREINSEVWETINDMEAHMDKRRDTAIWDERGKTVIQVLQKLQLVPNDACTFESLQRLCGILDVNSFELRSANGSSQHLLRGIYAKAALMAHDCRGNTHLTVDEKHQLSVYASLPIKKGELISFNYTSTLLGTADRRKHLRVGKYFECKCSLCADPCELGSHLSSVFCPRCRKGFIGMQKPLENKPYGLKTKWQCFRCKKLFSGGMIRTTLDLTRSLIEAADDTDARILETLLKKLLMTFHTNHFFMIELKQKLMTRYRREMTTGNPPKKILERMLELCKEVHEILEIVEPGISRLKGITLYEMHIPMALLAHRSYADRKMSPIELAVRLEEAASILKNGLAMLLLEPASTPEGQLARRALQELKALTQSIADVKCLPAPKERKTKFRREGKSNEK